MPTCTGSRSNGQPCKAPAIKGHHVCATHGGRTPQVKRVAARNLARAHALETASREVQALDLDITPEQHIEALLEAAARDAALWDYAVKALTTEGDDLLHTTEQGEQRIHPYVVQRNEAQDRWARAAKLADSAEVSRKRIDIDRQRMEREAAALKATLATLGLTAEQQARGLAILADKLRAAPQLPEHV